MVAEVFPYGNWKNLMEVEDTLTLDELDLILNKVRDAEYERHKFAASLKGVDLDEVVAESESESFDDIRRKADAALSGKSEEELVFEELGIDIETVEE